MKLIVEKTAMTAGVFVWSSSEFNRNGSWTLDMNEEAANMLAFQTRQQLAINALSLATQADQEVLKLF